MEIYCATCEELVDADYLTGKDVYPHRKDLYSLVFYQCPECENFVGTHKTTEEPLGCIVNQEIKDYRIKIHKIIDPLWKNKLIKRSEIYKYLTAKTGNQYHTAGISSVDEAEEIYDIVLEYSDKIKKGKSWKH